MRNRGPRSYWNSAGAGYYASTMPPNFLMVICMGYNTVESFVTHYVSCLQAEVVHGDYQQAKGRFLHGVIH